MIRRLSMAFILPIIVACGGQTTVTPDLVGTEVAVQRAAAATLTAGAPTVTKTEAPAITPTNTSTLTPTSTFTPTALPSATQTPSQIPTRPADTPEPQATASIEMIDTDRLNEQLANHKVHEGLRDMEWSPSVDSLAIASERGVFLFSTDADQEPIMINEGIDTAAVAFHPSGRYLATAMEEDAIQIWDLSNREVISQLTNSKSFGEAGDVYFNPDGSRLYVFLPAVSGSVGSLYAYDVADVHEPIELYDHPIITQSYTSAFTISPDGSRAAVGHFLEAVEIYDLLSSSTLLWSFDPLGPAVALAFSADSRQVASGTLAGIVEVFNVELKAPMVEILPPVSTTKVNVEDIVFRKGNEELILGVSLLEEIPAGYLGSVTLWSMTDDSPLANYRTAAPVIQLALNASDNYLAIATETEISVVSLVP